MSTIGHKFRTRHPTTDRLGDCSTSKPALEAIRAARPMLTVDARPDSVGNAAVSGPSVADEGHPKTHASTRIDLAHFRETSREKGERRGVHRSEMWGSDG